ncbi:hypothetical protein CRYUN_Cryun18bG0085700 [Craigia yunnanensis]
MHLWDKSSGSLADFSTHFSFSINAKNNVTHADGLAFFITSLQYNISDVADGSGIGLATGKQIYNSTENPFVAVGFDTYHNDWDPENDHVGIDINSLASSATITWYNSVMVGKMMDAWINYNSISKILHVSFTGFKDNTIIQQILQYELDFRDYLSKWATFGFSSSTGVYYDLNTIHSWYFRAKKKTLAESIQATNNFVEEQKLGEGGFGAVYRGILKDLTFDFEVAVKKISTTSHQGIKEYASKVMVTSQLWHKNLVQLIG